MINWKNLMVVLALVATAFAVGVSVASASTVTPVGGVAMVAAASPSCFEMP
jgi:hypothetical protein